MRIARNLAITPFLSVLLLAPLAGANAQSRPSAAEVLAKYVAATGGKAEIQKLTSVKQVANMDIVSMGISGTMEVNTMAPNKSRMVMTIPNVMEMQQVYDGTRGWDYSPQQGARLVDGKELAERQASADFFGEMLKAPERYTSLEVVGDTTINGEQAWNLKLVSKATGKTTNEYYSAGSGLLLLSVRDEGIEQNLEHRKFGPLTLPSKVMVQQGPQKFVVSIREVTFDSVPAAAFEAPEPVKKLIKP